MINEFVDRILVHEAQSIDGERVQEVEIDLKFIGKVEIPSNPMTPEEIETYKEQLRIRQRNALYQRRRRAKIAIQERERLEKEKAQKANEEAKRFAAAQQRANAAIGQDFIASDLSASR